MPIYAFECAACSHGFDRLQKLSDPDPVQCPECGRDGVRRRLTAPQFRLSGGGWYETDFKKDGEKKRNLAGEGDGAKKGADGGDKPAAAPAPQAGAAPAGKPAPGAGAASAT